MLNTRSQLLHPDISTLLNVIRPLVVSPSSTIHCI